MNSFAWGIIIGVINIVFNTSLCIYFIFLLVELKKKQQYFSYNDSFTSEYHGGGNLKISLLTRLYTVTAKILLPLLSLVYRSLLVIMHIEWLNFRKNIVF